MEFTLDEATRTAYHDFAFVAQIELAKAGSRRVAAAIRDYYRAYEQRSRWLREELVIGVDLSRYERTLIEEWELVFEAMRDELGDQAAEEAKQKAARGVLAWAESALVPIRPRVTEPFLTRGSLHMLADDARIGWHPQFEARLTELLQSRAAT